MVEPHNTVGIGNGMLLYILDLDLGLRHYRPDIDNPSASNNDIKMIDVLRCKLLYHIVRSVRMVTLALIRRRGAPSGMGKFARALDVA